MNSAEYRPIEPIGVVAEEATNTLLIEWSDGVPDDVLASFDAMARFIVDELGD